jgi:hypothetical protein
MIPPPGTQSNLDAEQIMVFITLYLGERQTLDHSAWMKLLFVLFLSLNVSSCGNQIAPNKPLQKIYSQNLVNQAVYPVKHSQTCEQDTFQGEKFFDLEIFREASSQIIKGNFKGLLDRLFVRSESGDVVRKSLYGFVHEDIYTRLKRYKGQKTLFQGQDVSVCPDEKYGSNTIEGAALNSNLFIHRTHEQIKSIMPQLKIPAISVLITPTIKQVIEEDHGPYIERKEYIMVDNAFYHPERNLIVFLPRSLERSNSIALWEVPMVASHEYGHHIFTTLFPLSEKSLSHLSCFADSQASVSAPTPTTRIVGVTEALAALNEGFSDLVAFYTLGKKERGVEGVTCLEQNRDVSSRYFKSGDEKIFHEDYLKLFFSTEAQTDSFSCDYPTYQDPHSIGAIFAYQANRFLTKFRFSDKEKLQLLLSWVIELKNNHKKNQYLSASEFMKESLLIFIGLTYTSENITIDSSRCQEMNEFYPGLCQN